MNVGDFTVLRLRYTIVFLVLLQSRGGKSRVIGPSQPIVAIVGEDIILPCRLDPPMNASSRILEWARPDLRPGFVYERRNGEEYVADKQPSYRGRTSVSVDKLELGDASMKLSEVTRSDEGTYRCLFPQLGQYALVELVVGVVSSPVISSMSTTSSSSGVVLQCEAKGWYPEPEVFWLDGEGKLLSAGPTETVRGPDDLYTVSRRLTVEKSDNFICRVQQKNIKQTRETHFYVPGHFFTVQSLSWIIIIILVFLLVIILTLIYSLRNGRHRGNQATLRMQEVLEVANEDANETAHEQWQEQQEEGREQLEEGEQLEEREQLEEGEQQEEERDQLEEGDQQDRTERLQTEEASAAGENTEEETKDNSTSSELALNDAD